MKKIGVYIIIIDHINTLYDDRTKNRSWTDISLFYLLPLIIASVFYFFPFKFPSGTYSALIAVFSVFSALLFSAQIALYSLSPKKPPSAEDNIERAILDKEYSDKKRYFADVNSNVSYLILMSCLSLIIFLVSLVFELNGVISGSVHVALVSHFFLTLLMLIKRSHIAFSEN